MLYNKKIIALCLARIQDEASNEYITALNQAVTPAGYSIFVYNTCSAVTADSYESSTQTAIYEYMDFDIIDVVIVYEEVLRNQAVTDALIEKAKKHGAPVIVIGEAHEGCINVKFDHENAFVEIVRHMVQEHHLTKLHFMAGTKGNQFSEYRLHAFRRVLQENGLPFDESMVSYGDFYSVAAERETEKIVASGNIPQAILCANDRMALAVCDVLDKHGIRVPEDVAVTGFDGIPEINVMTPRITSVVCDPQDLAEKTLEVLLQLDSLKQKTVTFPVQPRLSIAESCGCNEKKKRNASEYLNTLYNRLYRFQEEELELSLFTAQAQRCDSLEQLAQKLKSPLIYDTCCMVEKEYLDEKVNPIQRVERNQTTEKELVVVFDSDYLGDDFVPYTISPKDITPHLYYFIETGRVIIFTSLYQVDVPIGYLCVFFSELCSSNYMKVPQNVNALNNAFCGYRNLRYKQFLMNQIDEMYQIDTLTGLHNRRGFELEYKKLLASEDGKKPLTVVMADLDRLKHINDNYGHKEGDYAIHAVAQSLLHVCPEDSLFVRFGGDEMLAVCRGVQDVVKMKEEFQKYFIHLNATSNKPYKIEASTGIYITKENEILEFEELVEKSDALMYMEKKTHVAK
ncbi:MAG: GGDEF domain-containing protein [Lachnospiraceae bacterium]|nr:GGDEF domain-containing protein [Lachnospiraceae bacterium]